MIGLSCTPFSRHFGSSFSEAQNSGRVEILGLILVLCMVKFCHFRLIICDQNQVRVSCRTIFRHRFPSMEIVFIHKYLVANNERTRVKKCWTLNFICLILIFFQFFCVFQITLLFVKFVFIIPLFRILADGCLYTKKLINKPLGSSAFLTPILSPFGVHLPTKTNVMEQSIVDPANKTSCKSLYYSGVRLRG